MLSDSIKIIYILECIRNALLVQVSTVQEVKDCIQTE
jgi:hypothetical protein